MKALGLVFLALPVACGSGDDTLAPLSGAEGGADASNDATAPYDAAQPDAASPVDAPSADASSSEAGPIDAAGLDVLDASDAGSSACAEAGVPPSTLECAGLY